MLTVFVTLWSINFSIISLYIIHFIGYTFSQYALYNMYKYIGDIVSGPHVCCSYRTQNIYTSAAACTLPKYIIVGERLF